MAQASRPDKPQSIKTDNKCEIDIKILAIERCQ